jgi:(2Fe-2S) ferredoxin
MVKTRLVVCVNERIGPEKKSCAGSGSRELIQIIRQRMIDSGFVFEVIEQVCLGRCERGIAMRIAPGGPFFTEVTEQDVDSIIHALQDFKPPLY